jgi:D-alanyl-lipoteichoic acid acyltransferase DltB (MBOAT superfamily)
MGGNRRGLSRTIVNTLIVFLICGLWHGANWTYLVWGLYNVLLFLPLILMGKSKRYKDAPLVWKQFPQIILTFALVTLGWIIFRAPSVTDAWGYMCSMANLSGAAPTLPITQWIGIIFGLLTMIAFEWSYRNSDQAPVPHKWWIYYILVAAIWWYAPSFSTDFIYFQL